ncbi:uncharacterized protein CEXT_339481 [Caerostris extrusa]|uniref:Uncharacterized protein n=1 Tax=Caerostris extrusa TaxID=172846 RepID=A0AAV4Y1J6_CAEEX|nr:uncharacterized protein CEXT_339481 [Caerostris extrusa]
MADKSSCSYDHIKQVKVPLQITITSSVISGETHLTPNLNTNKNDFQCIRCGISMDKTKSIFINIQPAPLLQAKTNQSNMSMEILSKCCESNMSLEPAEDSSRQCGLSSSLHAGKLPEGKSCSDFNQNNLNISSSTESDSVCSGRRKFYNCCRKASVNSLSLLGLPHCCPERAAKGQTEWRSEAISLMLQVPCSIPPKESIECQTVEDFSRNDIGIDWNTLGIYPKVDGDEVDIHEKECLKEKEKDLEEAKDKQSSKPSSKQGALKTNGKTKETTKQGKTPEPLTASSLEEQPLPGKKSSTTQEKCHVSFVTENFQPGPLRKHIQKYHPDAHLPPTQRGGRRGVIAPSSSSPEEETKKKTPSGPHGT